MIYLSSLMALKGGVVFDEALRRSGAQCGVEVFSFRYAQAEIDGLKRRIEGFAGHPLTFHGPMHTAEMTAAPSTPAWDALFEHYERAFTLARWAGGKSMVAHTHERRITAEEKPRLMAQCRENLQGICALGAAYGITLRIENVSLPEKGKPLFDPEEYIALIKALSSAQALVDVGHVHVTGWNLCALIEALGEKIGGFHLHNNDGRQDSHEWLFEGTMDAEKTLRLLRRHTPCDEAVLEYGGLAGHTADDLCFDIERVRALLER